MNASDEKGLVTIKSFINEMEAEIARGYLESGGIQSFVFKDDCGGTRPHMQLTLGVELKVRQDDIDRASELLKAIETTNPDPVEPKPGENKAALMSLFAWVIISAGCGFFLLSLSLEKNLYSIGIVLIITGILIDINARKMKNRIKDI